MSFIGVALSVGGSLLGGAMASRGASKAQDAIKETSEADRQFAREMYRENLRDSRPNQSSDFGDLKWTQDPATGQWTQTNKLAAPEAARLEDYRQIAADRMGAAKRLSANLPQGAINYDALGLGKMASAVGVQGGGNSQNPNAGRQYSVQFSGGPQSQPGWGMNQPRPPVQGPSGGGGMMQPPPMGRPMPQQPPPQTDGTPPGPANLPGGLQPYQPTPIVPPPAAGAAPPPAAAAPPAAPEAAGPDITSFLKNNNGVYKPWELSGAGGEDAILKEIRKHDPNAYWDNAAMDGTDSAAQGRTLKFDQNIISGLLRKP